MSTDILLFSMSALLAIYYFVMGRFVSAVAFLALAAFLYYWRKKVSDAGKNPFVTLLRWVGVPAGLVACLVSTFFVTLPLVGFPFNVNDGWWGSPYIKDSLFNYATGMFFMILSGWILLESFPENSKVLEVSGFPAADSTDKSPFVLLLFLLPLTCLAMYSLFYDYNLPLGLVAMAATFLILAVLRWNRRETLSASRMNGEWKWLFLVLSLAALMRYPFIREVFAGFRCDESMDAVTPWSISRGIFLTNIGVKLFGVKIVSFRIVSLTLSMLSIFVFYLWCRLYFSPRASLLAAFLFSISWWHLFFAFSPFNTMSMILFVVCTFYFYEKAFQKGARADYWWAGVFAAATVMTYHAGRLTPAMVLVFVLGCGLFAGGMAFVKTYSRHLFLSFLGFLWILSVYIRLIIHRPYEFLGRARDLNILDAMSASGRYLLPVKTTLWTMFSYFWTSAVDPNLMVPNNPILDPFTGFLLLVGLVLTLFSLNKRVSWAPLGGVLFGIAANALAMENPYVPPEYLNPMRSFITFPFLMLIAARGIEWLWEMVDQSSWGMKTEAKVWLALGLAGALFFNVDMYFFRFNARPEVWRLQGYHHEVLAKVYSKMKPYYHLFLDPDSYSPIIFFYSGIQPWDVFGINDECRFLPIRNKVTKDVAVFYATFNIENGLQIFSKYYPHATLTQFRDPWNKPYENMILIPKSDIEAAQKGLRLENAVP